MFLFFLIILIKSCVGPHVPDTAGLCRESFAVFPLTSALVSFSDEPVSERNNRDWLFSRARQGTGGETEASAYLHVLIRRYNPGSKSVSSE